MSDLISRSQLLKEIEKYKFGAISNDAEREYIKKTILDFINFQPTAYSVENVVGELEKEKIKKPLDCEDGAYNCAICNAIEIVKQGSVRKDVNI